MAYKKIAQLYRKLSRQILKWVLYPLALAILLLIYLASVTMGLCVILLCYISYIFVIHWVNTIALWASKNNRNGVTRGIILLLKYANKILTIYIKSMKAMYAFMAKLQNNYINI